MPRNMKDLTVRELGVVMQENRKEKEISVGWVSGEAPNSKPALPFRG